MRIAATVFVSLLASFSTAVCASQFVATITDEAGRPIADAVVYLSTGTPASVQKPTTAEIDQVDKEFVPRVTVVQTGTAIEFPNGDNIRHHVYSFSPAKIFTLKLYSGRPSAPVIFDHAGMVVLGCNVHDHMLAWVLAVDTPWFAKTDARGRANIGKLPAGSYALSVWHAGLQTPRASGSVELNGVDSVEKQLRFDGATMTHSDGHPTR